MPFNYEILNLAVLDDLREVYAKRASTWTEAEKKKVAMGIQAMQIVAKVADTGPPPECFNPIPPHTCFKSIPSDLNTESGL